MIWPKQHFLKQPSSWKALTSPSQNSLDLYILILSLNLLSMAKPGKHCVGALAQITGLSTASLNGELGSLLCLTETGRWLVKIRGRTVAVKATNLRPQADQVPELFRRMVSAMVALQAQFFLELARSGATRRVVASCVPWISLGFKTLKTEC